jgi:hypothetical protein
VVPVRRLKRATQFLAADAKFGVAQAARVVDAIILLRLRDVKDAIWLPLLMYVGKPKGSSESYDDYAAPFQAKFNRIGSSRSVAALA